MEKNILKFFLFRGVEFFGVWDVCLVLFDMETQKNKRKNEKKWRAKKKKIAKKRVFVVFGQQKKILKFFLCCGVEFFGVWDVCLVLFDMEKQENKRKNVKKWIQHHTVPGWSPTPVLSGLKPR